MIDNVTLNDYRRVCSFCTIYIVLLIIGISRSFLFLYEKNYFSVIY